MMTYWRAAEVEARVASVLRSSKECEQVCEFESMCVRASKHISVLGIAQISKNLNLLDSFSAPRVCVSSVSGY